MYPKHKHVLTKFLHGETRFMGSNDAHKHFVEMIFLFIGFKTLITNFLRYIHVLKLMNNVLNLEIILNFFLLCKLS